MGSRQDLIPKDSAELHEIIWTSAEYNIRDTQCDVLVIFDCCYAGELEKSVRDPSIPRAFEYLAATSANSTTRKPGRKSFTTALIWALKQLATIGTSFTTQRLVAEVLHAPGFPQDQYPRLSERGPSCPRRISLSPLSRQKEAENPEPGGPEEQRFSATTDLSLRFVFTEEPTESVVTKLAVELRGLISNNDFKASKVLWEGLNTSPGTKYHEAVSNFYAHRWMRIHARKKSAGAVVPSPTSPYLQPNTAFAARIAETKTPSSVVASDHKELSIDVDGSSLQDPGRSGSDTGIDTPLSGTSGIEDSSLRRSARGSYKRKRGNGAI
jgi:hypothetical protein